MSALSPLNPLTAEERAMVRRQSGALSVERKLLDALEASEAAYKKAVDDTIRESNAKVRISDTLEERTVELQAKRKEMNEVMQVLAGPNWKGDGEPIMGGTLLDLARCAVAGFDAMNAAAERERKRSEALQAELSAVHIDLGKFVEANTALEARVQAGAELLADTLRAGTQAELDIEALQNTLLGDQKIIAAFEEEKRRYDLSGQIINELQERVAFAEKERDEAVAKKVAAEHAHHQRGAQLGEQIRSVKRERDNAFDLLAKETAEHKKTRSDRDDWKVKAFEGARIAAQYAEERDVLLERAGRLP